MEYITNKTCLLVLIFLSSPVLFTQICTDPPVAQTILKNNGVRARLTTGGDLWFDGANGGYTVMDGDNNPFDINVTAIFAGGLWMFGSDPGGGITGAAQQYGRITGRFDYGPGPLDEDGQPAIDCARWDRFWMVTQTEVRQFVDMIRSEDPDPAAIPASIAGWPATGNPLFFDINGFELPDTPQGLAPFFDADNDGLYNPLAGDYPLFCGDRATWFVINAAVLNRETNIPAALPVEVQVLAYAIDAVPDNLLHRSTFYDFKVVNRGTEDLLDFYAGTWIDFDLGCYTDDLFGTIPEQNLVYVHNEGGDDRLACPPGAISFETPGVVQLAQIVDASVPAGDPLLHSVTSFVNAGVGNPLPGTTSPETAVEYYNLMRGLWPDGTPMTRSGEGYREGGDTTRYIYDGGDTPEQGRPWLQCLNDAALRDQRAVLSTGPYDITPGAVANFSLALTTLIDVSFPDQTCPDLDVIVAAGTEIKSFYDGFCSPDGLVSTDEPLAAAAIEHLAFPNPTTDFLKLHLPAEHRITRVDLLDATGRQVFTATGGTHQLTLDFSGTRLPSGLYFYRAQTTTGREASGKIILQ